MNRRLQLLLLSGTIALSLNEAHAAAAIEGVVKLPPGRSAPVVNQRYEIVANAGILSTNPPVAIVYLEGDFPMPGQPVTATIAQKDMTFIPALLPIQTGSRVEFPNADDTYHNIFSYSPAKRFDLGRYRADESPVPSVLFDTAGLVVLRCDIHDHMRALIMVLATPHFVLTDPDGRFRLTGLPAGKYTLKAWLNSQTTLSRPVELHDGDTLQLTFPVKPSVETKRTTFAGYRTKLLVSMMLLVTVVTSLALLYAQRNVAATARRDLEREFRAEFAALRAVQEIRHAALAERCRALARKPRLHAALEDNALDLLYPSARDELLDVMSGPGDTAETSDSGFRARFYRFLDAHGGLLAPAATDDVPPLPAAVETRLALPAAPTRVQTGYLFHSGSESGVVDEIIAMPIFSTETGAPIATLVVGFAPFDPPAGHSRAGVVRGIWSAGRLHLPALAPEAAGALANQLAHHLTAANQTEGSLPVEVAGVPSLLFYKEMNPGSPYPPASEIGLYPLTESMAVQRHLTWRFAGAGGMLLFAALGLSRWLAQRLSVPVERLAVDSVANLAGRRRAEAALETTHEELQRSARFSADASHQLKTPVTVLRIGLEELLARERLSAEAREEISGLVHQTFRLTSLIEDLLLLSRMDAGRLQLELGLVDLKQLIDASLDDLGALPDDAGVAVETDFPDHLPVVGERRYTSLILQNLLENARKYNRSGGRICVSATVQAPWVTLTIGNTGLPIPPATQQHIFERFHRGAMAENLPGHGLGLNLARQLARLHLGELRLVRSENDWTEFEVRFQLATPSTPAAP